MGTSCEHLTGIRLDPLPPSGCADCIAAGDSWVHLRYCVSCGYIGCCNSSKNQHASKHARASGHPVIRSKEPGENWAYCYVDDIGVNIDPA